MQTQDKCVIVEAYEIRGNCPVYKKGDRIVIMGGQIDMTKTDAICAHAMPSLLYYCLALRENADPMVLGLTKEKNVAYLQCPDPGDPYTKGGTVIFQITRQIREENE